MSVNVNKSSLAALASATSANGTARNGTSFVTSSADPGAISVLCTSTITTSSVAATFKLPSSLDNSTWYDIAGATATTATGTASPVTTRLTLSAPISAHAAKFFRVVATLAGAATDPADVTSATYQFVPFGYLWTQAIPT
jgi:hypothetical protein